MNGPLFPRTLFAHVPAETVAVVMAAGTVGDVRADANNCTI